MQPDDSLSIKISNLEDPRSAPIDGTLLHFSDQYLAFTTSRPFAITSRLMIETDQCAIFCDVESSMRRRHPGTDDEGLEYASTASVIGSCPVLEFRVWPGVVS